MLDTISFITLADDGYLPGVFTLCHSIRRWYRDIPIHVWYLIKDPANLARLKEFQQVHNNIILHDANPYKQGRKEWYLKPDIIEATDTESFIFMDADVLLTYKIPSVFDTIEEGFLWGCRSGNRIPAKNQGLTSVLRRVKPTSLNREHSLLTSGIFGCNKELHKNILDKFRAGCADEAFRKTVFGDMHILNYHIAVNNWWPKVHYCSDNSIYGTILCDMEATRFKDGLFIVCKAHSKGIIRITHYNGSKPWTESGRLMPKRKLNTNSIQLWDNVNASVQAGNSFWVP